MVSKGFSNLFLLRKDDLEDALRYYPKAKRILNLKAQKMIKEKMAKEKEKENVCRAEEAAEAEIFFSSRRRPDPALLSAVMTALPPDSLVNQYLTRGSRANKLLED